MCIFCQIAEKKIEAVVVYEDDQIIAFKDVHPIAPVHVLVIPKSHVSSVNDFKDQDEELVGRLVMVAKKIAQNLNISENGYKLLIRVGKDGGQEVQHVHLHLIGGAPLQEVIRPV